MFWEVRETCRTVDSQWLLKISSDSEIGQLFDLFLSLSPHLHICIVLFQVMSDEHSWRFNGYVLWWQTFVAAVTKAMRITQEHHFSLEF